MEISIYNYNSAEKSLAENFVTGYDDFVEGMKSYNVTGYDVEKLYKDFLYCEKHFKCKLDEYFLLKYYIYNNNYRKDFLTKKYTHSDLHYVNMCSATTSKYKTYLKLKKYYKRECILADSQHSEDLFPFIAKHGKVIVKPDCGSLGNGIEIISSDDINACAKQFARCQLEPIICEEIIKQHPAVNELCPVSVNTCRFLTLYDGNEVKIVAASLKMSKGENRVDNMSAGGVGAAIDIETGILSSFGIDYQGNRYAYHPYTGKQIIGTQLPDWEATKELIENVHKEFTECAVLGTDVAFSVNGPCVVELNNVPGPLINQLGQQKPCGKEIHEFVKHNHIYKIPKNF